MPAIQVNASNIVCRTCGTAYGRNKGYFPVSHGELYKGIGYLPYCRDCVEKLYVKYLAECNDKRLAVRQVCRKLDIYWNEKVFEVSDKMNSSRTLMTSYLTKVNLVKYAGMSYDDTLREEGVLWVEPRGYAAIAEADIADPGQNNEQEDPVDEETPEEIVMFWGPGYTNKMYMDLEQRRQYWISRFPKGSVIDIGTEAIIRQICNLEIDINIARAAGKPIDKYVNSLNTLLGSAMLKPNQIKEDPDIDLEKMPLGVGIQKWEQYRPLPKTPDDCKDVNKLIKNISIWYLGHACKMLGIRNGYSKMYEEKMEELRVKQPEYEDTDDEEMLYDIFGGASDGEESE